MWLLFGLVHIDLRVVYFWGLMRPVRKQRQSDETVKLNRSEQVQFNELVDFLGEYRQQVGWLGQNAEYRIQSTE